jgi:diadenosine tetraphosphate (Ap4A) HIT family hydrolase
VADYFDLHQPERNAIQRLLDEGRTTISSRHPEVAAFNIGINSGEAAGQTIFHCHVHLIPRKVVNDDRIQNSSRTPAARSFGNNCHAVGKPNNVARLVRDDEQPPPAEHPCTALLVMPPTTHTPSARSRRCSRGAAAN